MDVFPSGHDQGRSIITVTGDVDLANAGKLLVSLTALFTSARCDIGLDLSGVTFIDCSGLRTLIAISTHVRAHGASVKLTAMSPVVVRLLELVDAVRDTIVPATVPTATGGPACDATRRSIAPEPTATPRRDYVPG